MLEMHAYASHFGNRGASRKLFGFVRPRHLCTPAQQVHSGGSGKRRTTVTRDCPLRQATRLCVPVVVAPTCADDLQGGTPIRAARRLKTHCKRTLSPIRIFPRRQELRLLPSQGRSLTTYSSRVNAHKSKILGCGHGRQAVKVQTSDRRGRVSRIARCGLSLQSEQQEKPELSSCTAYRFVRSTANVRA